VNIAQLASRDGWECWICENDIDADAVVGSANAASMDHVVPKSLGGTSSDDNLRLAHRRCNSSRGSKLPELLWPHAEDLIDSAPLWPALLRLQKGKSPSEIVAFFTSRQSADEAATWVVMKATQLTGETWIVEVEATSNAYNVRLTRTNS
jgi:hypothetical protein